MEIHEIQTALHILGDNPDDIVSRLAQEGCFGRRGIACSLSDRPLSAEVSPRRLHRRGQLLRD
jgi:hypothetical protein